MPLCREATFGISLRDDNVCIKNFTYGLLYLDYV
jgi:hypothetical protein